MVISGWPKPTAHWWFKSDNRASQPKSKTGSGAFKISNKSNRYNILRSERTKTDPNQKTTEDFSLEISNLTSNDAGIYFVTVESTEGKGLAQLKLSIAETPSLPSNKPVRSRNPSTVASELALSSRSGFTSSQFTRQSSDTASQLSGLSKISSMTSNSINTSISQQKSNHLGSQQSLASTVATRASSNLSKFSGRQSNHSIPSSAISKISKISGISETNHTTLEPDNMISTSRRGSVTSVNTVQSRKSQATIITNKSASRNSAFQKNASIDDDAISEASKIRAGSRELLNQKRSSLAASQRSLMSNKNLDQVSDMGYLDQATSDKPYFIKPLIDKKVDPKQTVSIDCEISVCKDLSLRWFINGKQISNDRRYFFENRGNMYRLVIPRADKNLDSGTIHVEATNKYGTVSCNCSLQVLDEIVPNSTSEDSEGQANINKEPKIDRSMPPIFTKPPKDFYHIDEGERLRICAIVDGYPEPEVNWFHVTENGEQFITDKKTPKEIQAPRSRNLSAESTGLNISSLDPTKASKKSKDPDAIKFNNVRLLKNAITNQRILELDKVRINQSGKYICRVNNEHGTAEIDTELNVKLVPKILPPPPKSKKGSYFRKLYKVDHEISRGTSSILKIGAKRENIQQINPNGLQIRKSLSEEEKMKYNVVFKNVALIDKESKNYAITERNALLNIQHTNVVTLIDNFKCYPLKHVLVLESLDIELFDHIILKNRVSETLIANLIGQLLNGIKYIHTRCWVHLDIQPSNIMVKGTTADIPPVVKIIDFAYSRKCDTGPSFTNIHYNESNPQVTRGQTLTSHKVPIYSKFGQPEFISPEQAIGAPCGYKTDLWSVGVILYLVLSGVSPFYSKDSDKRTLENIKNAAWVFDVRTFREISRESKDLISSFLKKNIDDRLDVAQALKHEWFNVAPAKTVIKTEKLRYFQSRRRWSAKISGLGRPMQIRPIKDIITAANNNPSYTMQCKTKKPARISDTSSSDDMQPMHDEDTKSEDTIDTSDIETDSFYQDLQPDISARKHHQYENNNNTGHKISVNHNSSAHTHSHHKTIPKIQEPKQLQNGKISNNRPPVSNVTRYGAGNAMFAKQQEEITTSHKVQNWGNASFGGFSAPTSETSSHNGFNTDNPEYARKSDNLTRIQSNSNPAMLQANSQNPSLLSVNNRKQVSFEENESNFGGANSDTESSLTSASQLHFKNNLKAGQNNNENNKPMVGYDNLPMPKFPEEIVDDLEPPILSTRPPKPPKSKLTSFVYKAKSALNIHKSGKDSEFNNGISPPNKSLTSSFLGGFNKIRKSNSSSGGFITSSQNINLIQPGSSKNKLNNNKPSRNISNTSSNNSMIPSFARSSEAHSVSVNAISNGPMSFPDPNSPYQHLNRPPRSGSSERQLNDFRRNPAAAKRESFDGSLYPTKMTYAMEAQTNVAFKSMDNMVSASTQKHRPKRGILKKNISNDTG